MKLCAFLLLCVIAPLNTVWATDYCDPKLCTGVGAHIGCGANYHFGPQCPADAEMIYFSAERMNLVVTEINKYRNLIAGGGDPRHLPACRMATISWDQELAELAELNVRQCFMMHDQCRNTDYFKFAGQNLIQMSSTVPIDTEKELKSAIKMWYDEVVYSNMNNIRRYPYNGFIYGHFTTLVCDKNVRVGCGASAFSTPGSSFRSMLIACNFAYANVLDYPIYKDCPTPAMKCTSGTNPQYPNLCSITENIDPTKLEK